MSYRLLLSHLLPFSVYLTCSLSFSGPLQSLRNPFTPKHFTTFKGKQKSGGKKIITTTRRVAGYVSLYASGPAVSVSWYLYLRARLNRSTLLGFCFIFIFWFLFFGALALPLF